MVSRERLKHLGATLAERATTKRVRLLGQVLLLAAIVFALLRVRSLWHGSHVELGHVEWVALVGSLVLVAVGTISAGWIWVAILAVLGVPPRRTSAAIFFQAQLAKYIPGSVWQYAGRAALANAHGIPMRPVGVSLPVEFTASAIAGGSMAAFLVGWWGAAVVGLLAVVLVVLERLSPFPQPAVRATIRATLLYLPVWLVLGASFWLCARGLLDIPVQDLALYIGAFAVAFLAGLFAIYAPGGLGVREAVLVALLAHRIGPGNALVVAAVSRLMFLVVDVVLAAIATTTLRRDRSHIDVGDPA
jgi:uncharacterized membrane protein YbhN (UPF0104 family)